MKHTGIASIDALYAAFGELRRALDARDTVAITNATQAVKVATDDVRAQGAWKMDPERRAKLEALKPIIESARVRVNVASDDARQRIALLAQRGAHGASSLTYGR